MTPHVRSSGRSNVSIDAADYLANFRTALATGWIGDCDRFMPPPEHPAYRETRREILRLDLAAAWKRGQQRLIEHYFARFPSLVEETDTLRALAEEERYARRQWGEEYDFSARLLELGIKTTPDPSPVFPGHDGATTIRLGKTTPVQVDPGKTAEVLVTPFAQSEESPTKCVEIAPIDVNARDREAKSPADHACPSMTGSDSVPTTNLAPNGSQSRVESRNGTPKDEFEAIIPDQYRVVRELGRGACGVVFLARELELAGREVAIKISKQQHAEPQTLARLQHPNIVPLYSLHVVGAYQVMVMPYLGDTTLAHLIKEIQRTGEVPRKGTRIAHFLSWSAIAARGEHNAPLTTSPALTWMERQSYCNIVLRFGAELAGGLAHAHERGILHRDIKPGNVLIANDGKAMLLDFNIAEDQQADSTRRVLGGTLTHAAPEQLAAMRARSGSTDARADIYSLGVILYELLTGKSPFGDLAPNTDWTDDAIYHDRLKQPELPLEVRRELSPSIVAILNKCLMPRPEDRYQRAEALREDILQQLGNRPLIHTPEPSLRERAKKWWKRNPRVGVGLVCAVVLMAILVLVGTMLVARQQRMELIEAEQARDRLASAPRDIQALFPSRKIPLNQLHEVRTRSQEVLAPFRIDDRDDWWNHAKLQRLSEADQHQIREQASELMYLAGESALTAATRTTDSPHRLALLHEAMQWSDRLVKTWPELRAAHHDQRVRMLTAMGRTAEAEELANSPPKARTLTASPLAMAIQNLRDQGPTVEVIAELKKYARTTPPRCDVWMALGSAYQQRGDHLEAYEAYSSAAALNPESPWPFFHRGVTLLNLQRYAGAEIDFSACIDRHQSEPEVYYNRAIARSQQRKGQEALDDLATVEEQGGTMTRLHFLRADILRMMGKPAEAAVQQQKGLELDPSDSLSFVTRAQFRLRLSPPQLEGAIQDLDAAIALDPSSRIALETKGMILSDRLKQYDRAIPVFQELLRENPYSIAGRGMLGIAYARSGKAKDARGELNACLGKPLGARENYILGCGFALLNETPEDRLRAIQYLKNALRGNLQYGSEMKSDSDLVSVLQNPDFQKSLESALFLASDR